MFVNCSNHQVENWSQEQICEAEKYGEIKEYAFPYVGPSYDEDKIQELADVIVNEISKIHPKAVMCQGEFTLTYNVVAKLKALNIKVVAACSERKVIEKEQPDGSIKKISEFKFVRFREY